MSDDADMNDYGGPDDESRAALNEQINLMLGQLDALCAGKPVGVAVYALGFTCGLQMALAQFEAGHEIPEYADALRAGLRKGVDLAQRIVSGADDASDTEASDEPATTGPRATHPGNSTVN